MNQLNDDAILQSWRNNVRPWVAAIENGEIASRVHVTNQAIMDAVTRCAPKTVLDVGCGEGWLVRELVARGIDALGVDAIPEFIACAQQHQIGRFKILSYEQTSYAELGERFDVVVCNFSLLGQESVTRLFEQIPSLLTSSGVFIVQTLHPVTGCGDSPYEDGWRAGSWAGFSGNFNAPAPWYFRTVESWTTLFKQHGFRLDTILEPLNPVTRAPASIVFFGTVDP